MSLESSIASVLRKDPAGRISFKVDAVAVNKLQMESVAKAIEGSQIAVVVGGTGSQLGAAYSSWKGRRWNAGETKYIGQIKVGSAAVVNSVMGKAAVFHESVHAMMDVKNIKIPMHDDEVIAYLADAMYLKASKLTNVSGGAQEKAIYAAAFAIIDKHKMLTKSGVALKGSDCSALRDAIKAHPAYH